MRETYTLRENFFWYFKQVRQLFPILIIKLIVGPLLFAASCFLEVLLPTMLVKEISQQQPLPKIFIELLVIAGLLGVTRILLSELENRTTAHQITVRSTLGRKLTSAFLSIPYDFLIEAKTRKEYKKATDNATSSNASGTEAFYTVSYQIAKNLMTILVFGITVSYFSPLLFVVILCASLLNYFGLKRVLQKRNSQKAELAQLNLRLSYLEEVSYQLEAAKDMRLYPTGPWLDYEMTDTMGEVMTLKQSYSSTVFFSKLLKAVGLFIQLLVTYGYLAWGIVQRVLSLTEFTLYSSIFTRLNQLAEQLVNDVYLIQQANSDLNDYRQWLTTYGQQRSGTNNREDKLESGVQNISDTLSENNAATVLSDELTITFENVSYTYSESQEPTIKNLSFCLEPGRKTALVGANGAGKTTIVKLLTGLLTPTSGRILVNRVEVKTLERNTYYQQIAPVFQENIVLATSLGRNVSLEEEYSADRVWVALEKAGIAEKVRQLKEGLETQLTRYLYEEGVELSGGETQRLMLARALYKDAAILVLDEPTAALDALAEEEMYKNYHEMTKEKTSLFISHRLASTRFCDEILFIESGELVEQGSHQELIAAKRSYAEMYAVQSHYYREEADETTSSAI